MNREYLATLAIAEQAAEWLERLPTATAREGEPFLHWLRQSPVHAREFFLAVRTAERLKHLDSKRLLNVEPIIAAATQSATQIKPPIQTIELSGRAAVRQPRIVSRRTAAAILGFMALLVIVTATLHAVSSNSVTTAAGESRTFHLADGSVLRAGPRTQAKIAFTDRERVVQLLRGELIICVAKDSSRPLYVKTDLAAASAVGTAFAVRRYETQAVVVTVQEGSVSVSRAVRLADPDQPESAKSAIVSAGEQLRMTADGGSTEVRRVDLSKELAWVAGKLKFTNETLGEAIREFNLRNETQIALLSHRAEHRSIRGAFDAAEPRVFARSVAISANLTLVEDQNGTLLLVPSTAPEDEDSRGR
jgi:transmembrane sensor